jgi:amino acid adenylation domain-containing protein
MNTILSDTTLICDAFERQARLRPQAGAVHHDGNRLSYGELHQRAGRIAGKLARTGLQAGDVVAVCTPSYVDFVPAVLGTIKAGGVYLPIPYNWPAAYRQQILKDSGAACLLAGREVADAVDFPGNFSRELDRPLTVIYSAHSVGKPQGVMLSHRHILDWLRFNLETLKIDVGSTLFIGGSGIDAAFPLWLANLVTGGKVYFCRSAEVSSAVDISRIVNTGEFKSVVCPLYFLERLIARGHYPGLFPEGVGNIVTLGEETFAADAFKDFLKERGTRWYNYYGFPQVSLVSTIAGSGQARDRKYGHIGVPATDTNAYILDGGGKLLPVGIEGELHVSGSGRMSAYHRSEHLNRLHFIHSELVPGIGMYKTGWRALWQEDGKISLCGRIDSLVHINGCPIAPEEVEQRLSRHPRVSDCACVVRDSTAGAKRLTVYAVLEENTPLPQVEAYLQEWLPPEIFPLGLVQVSTLAYAADGSVDRAYLKTLDILDTHQVKCLEKELEGEAGVDRAVVLAAEWLPKPTPLYVRDFLPPAPGGALGSVEADSRPGGDGDDRQPGQVTGRGEERPLAIIHGAAVNWPEGEPRVLADALKRAADLNGDNGIIYIHGDGSQEFQSYPALIGEAERVLSGLRATGARPGDKVIFQFNRSEDFVAGLWGCILGGMVAVPLMVPRSFGEANNETDTLYNVWNTLKRPLILCSKGLRESLSSLAHMYDFDRSQVLVIEELKWNGPRPKWHQASENEISLILFTSGSTGKPKGVMQPHRTILARERGTIWMNRFCAQDISINWMPLEHVGGVVMFHLRDIYSGSMQVQVRTDYILSEPLRWLDLISKYRATNTWAPNFAYGLINDCMAKREVGKNEWDLSSMRFILNGGEAINAATVKRFLKVLAPFGLPPTAMNPAWGMSETCSGVVYSHRLTADPGTGVHYLDKNSLDGTIRRSSDEVDRVTFVELGEVVPGDSLRIVDSKNRVLPEGVVGRLQIRGETVTTGYFDNPELNSEVFTADGWLDTGDLGFISGGRMTITGRAKDVIIINGINYNNVEIESTVEEVEGVVTSYTAACAVQDLATGRDQLVLFYHPLSADFDDQLKQIREIRQMLIQRMGLRADFVIPVGKDEIPKTSIGKIQRLKLTKLFQGGRYDDIIRQVEIGLGSDNTLPPWFFVQSWHSRPLRFAAEEHIAGKNILIFCDDEGLDEALVNGLQRQHCRCLRVKGGKTFGPIKKDFYEIDFNNREDYRHLFEAIADEGLDIHDIFHLCCYGGFRDVAFGAVAVRAGHFRGVYSLLYMIQALKGRFHHSVRLFVVGSHGQFVEEADRLAYEKWGIAGLLKSAALELSWLQCCHLDLEMKPPAENADHIVKEWKSHRPPAEAAYRHNRRLLPFLVPLDFNGKAPAMADVPIKRGGVYLVSGGLGGIGRHVCRWLMDHYKARLIVVGRSQPSARRERQQAFLDLDSSAGRFIYAAGDVADAGFLRSLKGKAESLWGRSLDGVFHLAGFGNLEYHWQVIDHHWLTAETAETFEAMFRSKVYGSIELHRLLQDNRESLFVAFSSTTAFFGAATFSAYAAANNILDGFCLYRRQCGYANTYCLNWSSWDNVGMSENNPPHMVQAMLSSGYEMITLRQGLDSLLVCLRSGQGRLLIGLNRLKRNIRRYLNTYPSSRQVLELFYTPKGEGDLSAAVIRERLLALISRRSPQLAAAVKLYPLDDMPTRQGLVDYEQLLAMRGERERTDEDLELPRDESEKRLLGIWREVLGKSRIGVRDNFFEVGGHSLKATVLASRIHQAFDIDIPLGEIFKNPTIRELSVYLGAAEAVHFESIPAVEAREYYGVSSPQRRLYILQQMDLQGIGYNIPDLLLLEGCLDTGRFEENIRELTTRHESLRTSFMLVGNDPVQKIHKKVDVTVEYVELPEETLVQEPEVSLDCKGAGGFAAEPGELPRSLQETVDRFIRPFDLSAAPLLRVGLVSISAEKHILMLDMHHIIADGISFYIFIDEFRLLQAGAKLPKLKIQYKDFSAWQNSRSRLGKMAKQEAFWLQEFDGEIPVLAIPTDFSRPGEQGFQGNTAAIDLDRQLLPALERLASAGDVTLYILLLAVYVVWLSKLGGCEEIVVGTPVVGRRHSDLDSIMGMFVNTLALRNYPRRQKTFKNFLQEVKRRTLAAFENQDYPFEDLVERVMVHRDVSRNPLFDVMLSYHKLEMLEGLPDMRISRYKFKYNIAKFDLTLAVENPEGQLDCSFRYDIRLFKEDSIHRFIGYFKNLFSSILDDPDTKIADLSIMSEAETRQILFDFNRTSVPYPRDKAVHRLFEEQAGKVPHHTALVDPEAGIFVSFSRLNQMANQLAARLKQEGVVPSSIVGLLVERSPGMVIGILAILKTGGAYLPLEPGFPQRRVEYIVKDSRMAAIVIHRCLRAGIDNLPDLRNSLAAVDLDDPRLFFGGAGNPDTVTPVESPAYVMYTSGSTGRPKGVVIQHDSVVNILYYLSRRYPLLPQNSYLLKTSFVFDVSVTELLGWFFDGGRLVVLAAEGHREPHKMVDTVEREQITHINFVPSMFKALLDHLDGHGVGQISCLKYIFLAGEALVPELVKRFEAFSTGIALEDLYGPTEGTVYASGYSLSDWQGGDRVPIGSPLANMQLYILDRDAHLQPAGIPGELCIAGKGVARGYLNNPELTAEKFVNLAAKARQETRSSKIQPLNPKSQILYRTGDLCRFLPDGNIEFFGRLDQQIKIRGFRIELAEIENCLLRQKHIKEAVVVVRKDAQGGAVLCAYFVSSETLKVSRLRDDLQKELPYYMVPPFFMQIDRMPLTATGKVDRRALPAVDMLPGGELVAPRNRWEEDIAAIWSAVLGVEREKIGIDHNFFELGGHSLTGIAVISRIHQVFHVRLSLSDIFQFPRIRGLAEYIKAAAPERYVPIEPTEKKAYYELSSSQKRLYILFQMKPNTVAYNLPAFFELPAAQDEEKLQEAFENLIQCHESFRTSFHLVDGEPVQRIHPTVDFNIQYFRSEERLVDLVLAVNEVEEGISQKGLMQAFIQPFDLSEAPLLRAGVLQSGDDRYVLMVDVHHIVFDGISLEIFQSDLAALYGSPGMSAGSSQKPLKIQYKDFARWQNRQMREEKFLVQQAYWLEEFSQPPPVLRLPYDHARPEIQSFSGNACRFPLAAEETAALRELARSENATLFMILLAAYYVLLFRLSGQQDIVVGTPVAGRRREALEHIVGMFVNTLPLRHYPAADQSFRYFLGEVQKKAIHAFENQEYPFEELVEKATISRDTGRNPLFDAVFTFQQVEKHRLRDADPVLKPHAFAYKIAKFDLVLNAREEGEGLSFDLEYSLKLFRETTVLRFMAYFTAIILEIVTEPARKIGEIEILSANDKRQLLLAFNNTRKGYPQNETIQRLFGQQAQKTPDLTAVVGPTLDSEAVTTITYGELAERTEGLAHLLKAEGLGPGKIAAIMVEGCLEMVSGILTILQAGGAFLPIDPGYPADRIDYLLADSGARIVLDANLLSRLKANKRPAQHSQPLFSNLAYVIYTSGSTGRPKGVMVAHRSLINLCTWHNDRFSVSSGDRASRYAGSGFDASVWETFPYLLVGASLFIVPTDIKLDMERLNLFFEMHWVSISFLPTQIYEQFRGWENRSLRLLLTGGDKLKRYSPGNYRLVNNYGPTENTVVSTCFPVAEGYDNIPIGRPIDNTQILVLDRDGLSLQPIGVPGELCIAGVGLARGYLNNPELTAERFVNLAAKTREDTRSYRTGDLVRWSADGNIEFLGRIDDQVKIRGNRIELGEIESQLLKQDSVEAAIVLAEEDGSGENCLVAYIVPPPIPKTTPSSATSRTSQTSSAKLRQYLNGTLPEYMIPSYFVPLEKIPLTPSGKVDRNALPGIRGLRPDLDVQYKPAGSEMENLIEKIWKDILKLDRVGIYDKFFDLGGNSLKFIQVNERLKEIVHTDIPVISMFRFPTIASLAKHLEDRPIGSGTDVSSKDTDRSIDVRKGKMRRLKRMQKKRELNNA